LIELGAAGYFVTRRGMKLFEMLQPLGEWAYHWAVDIADDAPG
jgi:DNA-binding HxlR family transcriptional regulator